MHQTSKIYVSCGLAYALSVIHNESSNFFFPLSDTTHPRPNSVVVYYFLNKFKKYKFVWNTNTIFSVDYFISFRSFFITFDFFMSLMLLYFLTLKYVVFKCFERKWYASCIDYSSPCMKRNAIFLLN